MMAEGILLRSGGGSFSGLTAVPADVLDNKTFMGSGSDSVQEGTMAERGAVSYSLPANGEYEIQPGHYNSIDISQSIATQGTLTYDPSPSNTQTANVTGKYMTGDVIVNPISNLSPGNIKKGVTIGGVTGTWEGYL